MIFYVSCVLSLGYLHLSFGFLFFESINTISGYVINEIPNYENREHCEVDFFLISGHRW